MDERGPRLQADVAFQDHVTGERERWIAAGVAAVGASGVICGRDAHVFVPADLLDNDSLRVCASCTVSESAVAAAGRLAGGR